MQDIELSEAQQCISSLLDEYRYNGQIIGREFPVILNNDVFEVVFVCPEQNSIAVIYNNDSVENAYSRISKVGLSVPEFKVLGLESQSDFVDLCESPPALILYSTYVQSCSPLRCAEHFAPVPLYKMPESVRKPLIKWQESHAACDQLQMNELIELEPFVIEQLSNEESELMFQGRELLKVIEQTLSIPAYLYLYRVGGESYEQEQKRACPSCGNEWLLSEPLFDMFDFKCDKCQLLSNISWQWQ